jgi:nucleotide-binding universal stress UspA family protein
MADEIVVATDFSPASEPALRVALDYARRLGARLHIIHVRWPGADPGPDGRLEALASSAGVPVTTTALAGTPASQIVEYARAHDATLIVIGTHGRTGVSRALIGSVAERVVRTAPCPVLVVPGDARPASRVESDGTTPAPHRCIVCGQASADLVCEPCRARIRGEAVRHKQAEERPGRS